MRQKNFSISLQPKWLALSHKMLRQNKINEKCVFVNLNIARLQNVGKLRMRVMVVIEVNGQMRNGHTHGLTYLNPIDTSACIMLTLYYGNADPTHVSVFAASDKLSQFELADQHTQAWPDLATVERLFQGVLSYFSLLYSFAFLLTFTVFHVVQSTDQLVLCITVKGFFKRRHKYQY